MTDPQITEEWLASVGFKWHELDQAQGKQWLLWLGEVIEGAFSGFEDLGVQVARYDSDGSWSCWLRSDIAHRYSRFIHIRHLSTRGELIRLLEALTGHAWKPENNLYGSMRTDEQVAAIRRAEQRLDQQFFREAAKRSGLQEDDTEGGALPEHKDSYEKLVLCYGLLNEP